MPTNANEFRWDARRSKAAVLVAEDDQTDRDIAKEIGINVTTLERWKRIPAFAQRVREIEDSLQDEMLKFAIAKRRKRVAALNDRWQRMQKIIAARENEYGAEWQSTGEEVVAGGDSGLLVHQQKAIGHGPNQQIIDEYVVDVGLLREMREHEKQAAQEVGQWSEKQEHSGPDGKPMQFEMQTWIELVRHANGGSSDNDPQSHTD